MKGGGAEGEGIHGGRKAGKYCSGLGLPLAVGAELCGMVDHGVLDGNQC